VRQHHTDDPVAIAFFAMKIDRGTQHRQVFARPRLGLSLAHESAAKLAVDAGERLFAEERRQSLDVLQRLPWPSVPRSHLFSVKRQYISYRDLSGITLALGCDLV